MASQNTPMGGDMDWNDPMFSSVQFDDQMNADSPFGVSAFNDFTNMDYADSPGLAIRTPSRADYGSVAAVQPGAQNGQQQHNRGQPSSASVDSSPQDSTSDTSSQHKRKTTESPISDPVADASYHGGRIKQEHGDMDMDNMQRLQNYDGNFDQNFSRPMHNLSLEQNMPNNFDFNSAASSPAHHRKPVDPGMTMDAKLKFPARGAQQQYSNGSPIQTINPGMFTLGPSRDQSPATNNMMFNNASPNAIFSTPSSDSNDAFSNAQQYLGGLPNNPAWSADYNSQFTSPGALNFTPSPVVNGASPAASRMVTKPGRSPLHIAPISTKSRVETQINVVMTLEKPPPNVETLHLPLHTIAKSKLLAKEPVDKARSLELHTMLVCTSAMRTPQLKEKAMQRAAAQNNEEIQRRAEEDRESQEVVDRNDMKNIDEGDRPANGGEVRICNNCIQRERKRAGRKKLKKEEEQQHWERYETERVVVFNSNEYLQFKAHEPGQQASKDGPTVADDGYTPPDGALQVTAAMRIACYCRHQSEKDGFQVIFTLKDQRGHVVAQEISDSILITDDHKTHPQSFPATMPDQAMYGNGGYGPPGLATSYSMMDMSTHMQPFTTSRSTGNLQGMAYQPQFNPHSHVHQMAPQGFASQASSATMTPTSLSRPGSPTNAGHSGPNKKRKSSTFHGRVPSGLTMTPRVDTNQTPSSNIPSAMSNMTSPFSPTGSAFSQQADQSYMTIPNNGPAQFYNNSNPPTPATEQGGFNFGQMPHSHLRGRDHAPNMAFYSAPGSRAQSRASSPAPPSGPNALATYGRHPQHAHMHSQQANLLAQSRQPHQQQLYQQQQNPSGTSNPPTSAGTDTNSTTNNNPHPTSPQPLPMIHKVTPAEGPTSGGTEISIYGLNFHPSTEILFGEHPATATTCYGDKALLCVSPPSRAGPVAITVRTPGSQAWGASGGKHVFTYKEPLGGDGQMMEMALRFLSERQGVGQGGWLGFAQVSAQSWVQMNVGRAGLGGGGGGGQQGQGGGMGNVQGQGQGMGMGNPQGLQQGLQQLQQQQQQVNGNGMGLGMGMSQQQQQQQQQQQAMQGWDPSGNNNNNNNGGGGGMMISPR